jgi:hypothetical protein
MRTGNCFEDAGKRATDPFSGENWMLVHGLPFNPAVGMRMPHGWLEMGDTVWDPNANAEFDRDFYYDRGMIKDTVRYTKREAAKMMCEHGTYGYWDEMFEEAEEALEAMGL